MHVTSQTMHRSLQKTARWGGLLYLLIIVCGLSGELLVRASLVVPGDGPATVNNILDSESLFRAGFVFDSVMLFSDVAIAMVFYALLKSVNQPLALAAAVFRLMQAGILAANLLNYHGVLLWLNRSESKTLSPDQLHPQVMQLLDMHAHGYDLGLIFFAVSNLILGYLLIRSRLFPALLGYGLQAAACVYLVGSYTRFLAPRYVSSIEPLYLIPLVAELGFCLWLLVKGVRMQTPD